MNILITGAFGFAGANLCKSLAATINKKLIALDIHEPGEHFYQKFYAWSKINDVDWATIDVVMHLAGKAHDIKNTTEDKTYFDINLGLTQKIFEHFLSSSANKFIFFSSVKAVADSVEETFLTEDEDPKPGTPYGKSKLEAERYVGKRLAEWERARERGDEKTERRRELETERGRDFETERLREKETRRIEKKVYILRPCMIHGPGNKGNMNLLYKLVQKGIPWPLGAFENKRSFVSMDNLAFVISQILESDIEPGIYNIADDEPLSTNRLIELIAESRQKKPRICKIGKKWIHLLAKPGDVLPLPLNSERLKKLTESYVVSNSKLKIALGIKEMPVTAEEGLRRTLASFKKYA